jgi:hypothetical protein
MAKSKLAIPFAAGDNLDLDRVAYESLAEPGDAPWEAVDEETRRRVHILVNALVGEMRKRVPQVLAVAIGEAHSCEVKIDAAALNRIIHLSMAALLGKDF